MRIAVVSPFVDRRHGTERAMAELLERLARDYGCEIHLYSQRAEDLDFAHSSAHGGQQGSIVWHKVPSIPGPHLLDFLFWLLLNSFLRWRDRAVHGLHFDVVLSPGINCFNANAILVHALFHRLRELARDEPNPLTKSGLLRRLHRRAYYGFLMWFERRIYSDPRVSLAAVSDRTASLLKSYFHRNAVRIIPNGVDTAHFSPSKRLALRAEARSRYKFQETDFVLVLIGNDWGNKGLSTVFGAMEALHGISLRLLVAGQDAAAFYFFETAKKLGLNEQCRREMTSVEALDLYAVADAYVSPTREDSFGLPVLEAMACGLPVITSVFAGASEIISDGVDGFVLKDPGDRLALAGHLKNLQERPELRLRIGERARRTAEAYTWERNAAAVWELLNEIPSKKHR